MRKLIFILTILFTMSIVNAQNPFFEKYNTPYGTVPFNLIKNEHFEPAIKEGIQQQQQEIESIINNTEKPTFENTIIPFEKSGGLLDRVVTVFSNLRSAETNDELQAIAQNVIPLLSDHSNNISLNKDLFKRIATVYQEKEHLNLNLEEEKLLENTYDSFVRSGANLKGKEKERYREITKQLSILSLQFSENNLKETNDYQFVITDKDQLKGLPSNIIDAAAETAKEKGIEGWVFTLQAPSYRPFMENSACRELREDLYRAYNTICTHDNGQNNEPIVREIANLNLELANLLGYPNYAAYRLEKRMADNSENVYNLLNQLLKAYKPTALQEVSEVEHFAFKEQNTNFVLMPWDWSYYANKLKKEKFDLNDEMLRPYFELSKVKSGVFGLATKLYGTTFKENKNIPVYHPDVYAYEVYDKDGSFLAVLYTDFHPREGKRAGAWMSSFKGQWIDLDTQENSRPHITLVMNFTKPTANQPALLTFDEVNTFLHEFGHALHGMFANSTFESLSGTSVYRDFVELPSQLMENFATTKEFLSTFATHYKTGKLIPDELIQKIIDSSNFNVAYACLRQLSFGFLDMAWYTLEEPYNGDVKTFEKEAWVETQLLPELEEACMSVQFSHIFAGGYAAGYYGYKWSEVLDADAFSLFKEKGIFNQEVAESFRTNILSKGGTEHPMILYKRFRGQEPTIDALLIRNGIKNENEK